METNVAFIGKIISVHGEKADIQPLGLIKQQGEAAKPQAPISDVPIARSARYKAEISEIRYAVDGYGHTETAKVLKPAEIKPGDLAVCICCDRDIRAAVNGVSELPEAGCHSKQNAVIVGII